MREDIYTVSRWEERGRLHIMLLNDITNEVVAEWWDEDAASMFEDGFFRPGKDLDWSVKEHCRDCGII